MFGFNYRNSMAEGRIKMSLHPFYAQSWHGMSGYWGMETAFGIGPAREQSWGKIVVRFTNGSEELMDHARGIDMHADLAFSEHLGLTAGAQQNDPDNIGNYFLLKWHANFGN